MKIYTSYFGNMKALSKENVMPISIARYSPKWYHGLRYIDVAPTSYMLSNACGHEEYLRLYDDILNMLDPIKVIGIIERMARGGDVALCCYEKPGGFCHRHLLAKWLVENTGYEVNEWQKKETNEQTQQLSLFE